MPRIILVLALFMALVAGCGGSEKPMRANDPNLSQAHVERAKFFWAHGEVNKTIQEMEWALVANPYNYEAAYNLGLIYLDQGQRMSARRVWQDALLSMEDGGGEQQEDYDNARKAADIRAALAELDKADRELGSPEAIVARQRAEQGQLLSETTVAQDGASQNAGQGGGATTTTTTTTTTSGYSSYSSQPGLPQQSAPGQAPGVQASQITTGQASSTGSQASSDKPGGPQYQPKPYVPSPQDGKPAPRSQAGRSGSGSSRASDCPPCAPQSSGKYAVQVSSNRQQKNAQNDVKRLSDKGYYATIATNQTASGTWYVVWAGCCTSQEQAQKLAAALKSKSLIPMDARVTIPK